MPVFVKVRAAPPPSGALNQAEGKREIPTTKDAPDGKKKTDGDPTGGDPRVERGVRKTTSGPNSAANKDQAPSTKASEIVQGADKTDAGLQTQQNRPSVLKATAVNTSTKNIPNAEALPESANVSNKKSVIIGTPTPGDPTIVNPTQSKGPLEKTPEEKDTPKKPKKSSASGHKDGQKAPGDKNKSLKDSGYADLVKVSFNSPAAPKKENQGAASGDSKKKASQLPPGPKAAEGKKQSQHVGPDGKKTTQAQVSSGNKPNNATKPSVAAAGAGGNKDTKSLTGSTNKSQNIAATKKENQPKPAAAPAGAKNHPKNSLTSAGSNKKDAPAQSKQTPSANKKGSTATEKSISNPTGKTPSHKSGPKQGPENPKLGEPIVNFHKSSVVSKNHVKQSTAASSKLSKPVINAPKAGPNEQLSDKTSKKSKDSNATGKLKPQPNPTPNPAPTNKTNPPKTDAPKPAVPAKPMSTAGSAGSSKDPKKPKGTPATPAARKPSKPEIKVPKTNAAVTSTETDKTEGSKPPKPSAAEPTK